MAVKVAKAWVSTFECDAPDCYVYVVREGKFDDKNGDVEPPNGIGGNAFEITGNGGTNAEFWACSREHVGAAIIAVLEESYNPNPEV